MWNMKAIWIAGVVCQNSLQQLWMLFAVDGKTWLGNCCRTKLDSSLVSRVPVVVKVSFVCAHARRKTCNESALPVAIAVCSDSNFLCHLPICSLRFASFCLVWSSWRAARSKSNASFYLTRAQKTRVASVSKLLFHCFKHHYHLGSLIKLPATDLAHYFCFSVNL